MERQQVYKIIDGEREYQDWNKVQKGWLPDEYKSPCDFIVYMQRYMNKAIERISTETGNEGGMHELRKVVALGVAAFEQFGVPEREQYEKNSTK